MDLSSIWNNSNTEKLTKILDQVFELEHLQILKLNNNQITFVPNSIGLLQNLTDLDLSNNQNMQPMIFIGAFTCILIIGVCQLGHDNRLLKKSYTELIKIVIQQLPLIGKFTNQSKIE